MTSNYKYTRNWENQQKAIFDGVGEYDIPVIQPEEYHHVNWIPYYLVKGARKAFNEKSASWWIDHRPR